MDWRVMLTAFTTVFLAELGDKTQLATLALATNGRLAVFVGASLALVANVAIAVMLAEVVGRYVSPVWVQRGAGLMFLVLGAWFLWEARPGAA